jgi:hypothetical protein
MRKELLNPLLAEASLALQQHASAEESGGASAIARARKRLEQARDALAKTRVESDAIGAIAKAMLAPRRLGSSGWLR